MELGHATRGLDLLVGHVRVGQREVVPDRRVEQVHPLGHDPEQAPCVVRPQLAEVATADEDLALRVVPEPEQQVDERGLARAARADDRQAAAGRHREADVVQDGPAVWLVAEGDAADVQGQARHQRAGRRRSQGFDGLFDRRRRVDDLEQASGRGPARAEQLDGLRQRLDGLEHRDGGERQQREVDAVQRAADHERNGQSQDGDRTQAREQGRQRHAQAPEQGLPLPRSIEVRAKRRGPWHGDRRPGRGR